MAPKKVEAAEPVVLLGASAGGDELRVQAEDLAASRDAVDAERERYGELFEFAPDAYLVTDARGKIVEANGAAGRLLGVAGRYLKGKLLVGFVDDSACRDFRTLLNQLIEPGAQVEETYIRMHGRDCKPFMAAVRAASCSRSGDSPQQVRWMIRDVTQRLEQEQEIRVLHAEVDLLASLGRVVRLTADPRSAASIFEQIVELAASSVPGCEFSISLGPSGDRMVVAAASGDMARRLDAAELEQGDGPCANALRDGVTVELTADECAARWPHFGKVALDEGLHRVMSHPLATPSGRRGALKVYVVNELTPEARELVPLLVTQVAVALTNAELYESAHSLATHLQRALESRGVIEQAKGVLIARQGCTDEQAFDILRRASQRMNRKLRDVAAELVSHVQNGDGRRAPDPDGAAAPGAK